MISPLADALAERGYDTLTPVQQAVIAPDLAEDDMLVSAQTGSGKTVGFGLAIAPTLLAGAESFGPAGAPLGLVIAPTRELAMQVMRELAWLYARTGAVLASCVGGMDMRQERRALERGAHLVVGTPGRLRDHVERGSLDLSALRAVVLDEADEMLDMGFREDLEFILSEAPAGRRTLMFSATVSPVIARLAQDYQRDARRINTATGASQHADIAYQAVRVAAPDVDNAIFNLLRFHDDQAAIVFANTRATVAHLTARLANRGLSVVSLSGELSQAERTHALQAMRDGRARVCVATDVAARGIDLPRLNLVIHADLPSNTESLLHRSGRTGRAGRKGISALIVPPRAQRRAENLLKWARISAEWVSAPSVEEITARDEERLLADPAWDEPISEEARAFAARLLARRSPEEVAAGFLRLHQARHAAPEDLLPPDAPAPRRERRAFGPSAWVALSVGEGQRAEARWLLPMLCRAGGLDRAAIGAIRVQGAESYVEIAEPALAGFLDRLGDGGMLEDGITARVLDTPPDLSARPERPARAERPARPDRQDRPGHQSRPDQAGAQPMKRAKGGRPADATPTASVDPKSTASEAEPAAAPEPVKSRPDPRRAKDAPAAGHGKGSRADGKSAARRERPATPPPTRDRKRDSDRPAPGAQEAPRAGGKPARKPARPPAASPAPARAAPMADARDTSKRFTPPGKDSAREAARHKAVAGKPGTKAPRDKAGKGSSSAPGRAGFKRQADGERAPRAAGPKADRRKTGGPKGGRPVRPGGDQPPRRGKS